MTEAQPQVHFITFPPFPKPPAGVQVTPWKYFKAAGIQVKLDDDNAEPELDGTGIPTIALSVRHDLTEAERRKKQKKLLKRTTGPGGEVVKLAWNDEWEHGEALRMCHADPALSRVDRLYQAVQDFRSSRPWPVGKVPALWDQWRHFIGIIAIVQSTPRKKSNNGEEDDEENDDDEEKVVIDKENKIGIVESSKLPQSSSKESEEAQQARRDRLEDLRDSRLEEFLSDPAERTKIFFSAHYRDKGLIWDEIHCRDGPILLHFFFGYLIRSRVFKEPELDRGLRQALEVCEIAQQELPSTHIIAKALDDNVSKGFQQLMSSSRFCDAVFYERPDEEEEEEDDGEPQAKKIKLEEEEKHQKQREIDILKEAIGDPSLHIINPDDMDVENQTLKDAIADNVDVNGASVNPTGSWGDPRNEESNVDTDNNTEGDNGGWGDSAAQDTANIWGDWGSENTGPDKDWYTPPANVIFKILGPTTFPLTHTTGIVENSTRRIVRVIPPKDASKAKAAKGAEAVEDDLNRRFAQLVLAPWANTGSHSASDVTTPLILPDSRGPFVPPPVENDTKYVPKPESVPGAYNPMKDEITVLIHPDNIDKLRVGMGLGATFVQLARKDPNSDEKDVIAPPLYTLKKKKNRKRGGPGKNGAPTNWWYIEQLRFAIPSFHTDKRFSDQD